METSVCLMLEKDMNINQSSEESGISRGTIPSVKNGKSCTDLAVDKIEKALDVPVEKLIDIGPHNLEPVGWMNFGK